MRIPLAVFIEKMGGMKSFVGKFQVPLLAFAAGEDTAKDCCLLTSIQDMQATTKGLGKPMELIVYADADHNIIAGQNYRADVTDDAWRRTIDALHQLARLHHIKRLKRCRLLKPVSGGVDSRPIWTSVRSPSPLTCSRALLKRPLAIPSKAL
jgi:hypothetical protein